MSIVNVNFFSESLMRTVNFLAIIPIDKRSVDGNLVRAKNKPFKTLYLLHGIYGNEYDWLTYSNIRMLAQNYNLAVIMPAGENKFYSDVDDSGDNFGKYVGEELVDFTRRMFCLSEKREDTFIAGLSMGGCGAILNGFRNPKTFGYIGAFSSAFVADEYPDSGIGLANSLKYNQFIFGKTRDDFVNSSKNYWLLPKKVVEMNEETPNLYMACGTEDFLINKNRKYRDYLNELGLHFEYHEADGGHEWGFWNFELSRFFKYLPLETKSVGLNSGNIGL